MSFYKNFLSLFFFLLSISFIILQTFLIYKIDDPYSEKYFDSLKDIKIITYLYIYKIIFYIFSLLTFISLLKSTFTEPCLITHENNFAIIQFYYETHMEAIKNAQKIYQIQGEEKIKRKIMKVNEENEYSDSYSDKDETEYEMVTSIPNELVEKIQTKYKMKLSRCLQCFVVRPNRSHHCSICKGCILGMDHHCPWINNCVGMFNKKFFILMNLYSLIGNIVALFISLFYVLYKNYYDLLENTKKIVFFIIQLVVCLIFICFNFVMIKEQFENIDENLMSCDFKKLKLLERRTFYDTLCQIFGGKFGINWFNPLKQGGYKNLYNLILKQIYNDDKND